MLGLGFYGRSFHLKDTDCSVPGCPFSGDADAGECTKNPGSLAYFEIMDIIKKQDPRIIHDEEIAVKYFQYGRLIMSQASPAETTTNRSWAPGARKDQWISFDDKETFKQKVDWANEIGYVIKTTPISFIMSLTNETVLAGS